MKIVVEDSIVQFHYQLTVAGQCYEKSDPDLPCLIQLGAKQLPGFLEPYFFGMAEGESKLVKITATEAYGAYMPQKVITIAKKHFQEGSTIQEGEYLEIEMASGDSHKGRVIAISDSMITLDLNHELAGKTLHFNIQVLSITIPEKVKMR